LGAAFLDAFLQIELPEHGPIALAGAEIFPTIGDFYDAISTAFQTLQPAIGTGAQVVADLGTDTVFKIISVADALKAIEEIKEQGEGTTMSPFQGSFDPAEMAHYYIFKEIQQAHQLQKDQDGVWRFTGPAIRMPGVMAFTRASDPHASEDFNVALSDLLRLMQQAWTTGPATIDDAIDQMGVLRAKGNVLIRAGVCPEFRWTDKTALA
jgi:hypothetical protein